MVLVQDVVFKCFEHTVSRLSLCTISPGVPDKQEFLGNAFTVCCKNGTCLFMTCNHCLQQEDLGDNQYYRLDFSKLSIPGIQANVAYRDADRDLALLRVDGLQKDLDCLTFVESDEVAKTGTDVVLLAFYAMHESVLDEPGTMLGKIVGLPDTTKPKLELIRANYTAKPGTSGSPVILADMMEVVGVHCEGEFAAKYAVSVQSVKAALRVWTGSKEDIGVGRMMKQLL